MKAIFLLFLFTVMAVTCFGIFQFGVGLDIAGKHGYKWTTDTGQIDKDYNVGIGISPAMEYLKQYNALLFGLGAEYQVQRNVDFDVLDGKMGFIPLFGVVRYQLSSPLKFFPELVGQFGYNFLTADEDYLEGDATVKGGLYWGAGAGIVIQNKYLIQLMYKTNYGKFEADFNDVLYKADITNSQLNLSVNLRY